MTEERKQHKPYRLGSRKNRLWHPGGLQNHSMKYVAEEKALTLDFDDYYVLIVECRRVLKWTYAYGFYLPDQDHAKRQFFEYLQGDAESGLERLHQCAEKELQQFLSAGPSKEFNDFRTKLAGLTSVTRNYFENLVRALENGLADVDSHGACSKTTSSKNAGGAGNKGKGGKGKGTNRTGGSSRNGDDTGYWSCEHCTFANAKSATTCQMCNQRR